MFLFLFFQYFFRFFHVFFCFFHCFFAFFCFIYPFPLVPLRWPPASSSGCASPPLQTPLSRRGQWQCFLLYQENSSSSSSSLTWISSISSTPLSLILLPTLPLLSPFHTLIRSISPHQWRHSSDPRVLPQHNRHPHRPAPLQRPVEATSKGQQVRLTRELFVAICIFFLCFFN